jgi:hypothetical protein
MAKQCFYCSADTSSDKASLCDACLVIEDEIGLIEPNPYEIEPDPYGHGEDYWPEFGD